MMNLTLAGHLGADPEERVTPSGQKVVTFRMAVNIRGGGKEETVWWRVTLWGDRFDRILPYIKKGSGLVVTGRMRPPNIWNDREGKPQVGLEVTAEIIEFLPGKRSQEGAAGTAQAGSAAYPGFSQQVHAEGGVREEAFSPSEQSNAFGQAHDSPTQTAFGQASESNAAVEEEPLPF